ncbi:MAG TPA: nucleic acid-binding protein, partial [Methanolinea sp.]|nr:nucleic acid-binding protein [Methanolinea sp.]
MTNGTETSPAPRREGGFEREPARRVFAGELRESRIHFKEGQDEKSPSFVLLPTGARCNRV